MLFFGLLLLLLDDVNFFLSWLSLLVTIGISTFDLVISTSGEPQGSRIEGVRMRRIWPMRVPITLNGLALGTVGLGILWLNVSKFYGFESEALFLVYCTSILASIFLGSYVLFTILPRPLEWWRSDITTPKLTSTCGAVTMTISLLAVNANLVNLPLPFLLPLILSILGAVLQAVLMNVFIYQCIRTRTLPEPFYNAVIHAITFNVLAVPGNSVFSIGIRDASLYIAMALLPLSSFPQLYRVLLHGAANDTSAALLQSGTLGFHFYFHFCSCSFSLHFDSFYVPFFTQTLAPSIVLTAWMVRPLTREAVDDSVGSAISHTLFANATFFFLMTLTALFQRRKILYDEYLWSPSTSSLTFPFVNTANASNLYRINFLTSRKAIFPVPEGWRWVIIVWVDVLTALATCIVLYVLILYFAKGLFIDRDNDREKTNKLHPNAFLNADALQNDDAGSDDMSESQHRIKMANILPALS